MAEDFDSLQPPTAPEPGWYPNQDGRQQWWDGSDWTDRFQDERPTRKGLFRSTPMIGLLGGITGFALGLTVGLLVKTGDDPRAAEALSADEQASPSTAADDEATDAPSSSTKASGKGDSGGLSLRLLGIKRSNTVTYAGGTYSDITPEGNEKTIRAKDGGYYLYVETSGRNGTKEPIDLTCGYPIDVSVLDVEGAKYSPIEGLDQIAGNPGCNAMTQPGQKFKEKFIFLLPKGAEPSKLSWFAVSSDLEESKPATINLPAS